MTGAGIDMKLTRRGISARRRSNQVRGNGAKMFIEKNNQKAVRS